MIPALGPMTADADYNGYASAPVAVPVLGGAHCRFVVVGYDEDERQDEFRAAIGADDVVAIAGPGDVWAHVQLGTEVIVQRDGSGEPVYISVESECAWEPEHGLQIVFRDGASVTKVGPFDGQFTNCSVWAAHDLSDVVYVRMADIALPPTSR